MKIDIQAIYGQFEQAIAFYHIKDSIDQEYQDITTNDTFLRKCHFKAWVDAVQWHLEDEIRSQDISDARVRELKARIDTSNQLRTNLVEELDDIFLVYFNGVIPIASARTNTETLAWSFDRLSILALKIYHMSLESSRQDIDSVMQDQFKSKLSILQNQKLDLMSSISYFIEELRSGKAIYKVYRQVKMYNDPNTNPVLRLKK